jgi:CRISPR-associated endonuclease/helicase Cas3
MHRDMSDTEAQLLSRYWGKADPAVATEEADHHTVLGHSLDVAAVAYAIVRGSSLLSRALANCGELERDQVAVTVAAWCALHDIGKIDTRFQRKAPSIGDRLRTDTIGIAAGRYDHGSEGYRQIEEDDAAADSLVDVLGEGALALLCAVCGHHGVLPARSEPDPSRSALPSRIRFEDITARRAFIGVVLQFFRAAGAGKVQRATGPLVQRAAGLCAVADWLGSNTRFFPYSAGPISDLRAYWERARERAASACRQAGLVRPSPSRKVFSDLFPGFVPRDVQLLTEMVDTSNPAIVIVEAEMGRGKTEAALSLAARFCAAGCAEELTVSLPTMATSNAMFARVTEFVPRLYGDDEVHMTLAHSRASRQERFVRIIERDRHAVDEDATDASVVCARWFLNRKRVLLAQVGVGTVDQALQAALVVRHQFVRLFGLSRNAVVIDEVHAYDAYMEVGVAPQGPDTLKRFCRAFCTREVTACATRDADAPRCSRQTSEQAAA